MILTRVARVWHAAATVIVIMALTCDDTGSRDRTRTYNLPVNSRTLCQLSYAGSRGRGGAEPVTPGRIRAARTRVRHEFTRRERLMADEQDPKFLELMRTLTTAIIRSSSILQTIDEIGTGLCEP